MKAACTPVLLVAALAALGAAPVVIPAAAAAAAREVPVILPVHKPREQAALVVLLPRLSHLAACTTLRDQPTYKHKASFTSAYSLVIVTTVLLVLLPLLFQLCSMHYTQQQTYPHSSMAAHSLVVDRTR
jgi:hypothetical protein